MDLSDTIIPKSDQLNAEDLLAGPCTVTIADVRKVSGDQPVDVHLVEFPGRPFRPSKTVRRILVAVWGQDGSTYVGRRMTLYRDPKVKWAGQEVGGIRVSHLSHIDEPLTLALTVTKGKRDSHVIRPLSDEPTPPTGPKPITKAQVTALSAGLTALGYKERPAIYAALTRELGRTITSSTELSKDEADQLIDRIQRGEVRSPAPAADVDQPADTWVEEPPDDWQPEDGAR